MFDKCSSIKSFEANSERLMNFFGELARSIYLFLHSLKSKRLIFDMFIMRTAISRIWRRSSCIDVCVILFNSAIRIIYHNFRSHLLCRYLLRTRQNIEFIFACEFYFILQWQNACRVLFKTFCILIILWFLYSQNALKNWEEKNEA